MKNSGVGVRRFWNLRGVVHSIGNSCGDGVLIAICAHPQGRGLGIWQVIWYPSVDDVTDMNINALDLSGDKHPHKMLGSARRISVILDSVKKEEDKGLTYQAALIMKEFVSAHIFDGGNHRTAYGLAKMFLRRNGKRLRMRDLNSAYPFIRGIGTKSIEEVREWIEHGTTKES